MVVLFPLCTLCALLAVCTGTELLIDTLSVGRTFDGIGGLRCAIHVCFNPH